MKRAQRRKLIILAVVAGVFLAAGGGYVARYHVWPAYRAWRITSINRMAAEFIAAKDANGALILVRRNLSDRPNDPEASRLGVKAALLKDSPDALSYQRNLVRVEPTAENQIELLRLALKFRAYSYAKEIVDDAALVAANHPDYHELSARFHLETGSPQLAIYHLISLLKERPDDTAAALRLADCELVAQKEGGMPLEWRRKVAELAENPSRTREARVLLLREAIRRGDAPEAAAAAGILEAMPELGMDERLLLLRAAQLYAPDEIDRRLAGFRAATAPKPEEIAAALRGVIDLLQLPRTAAAWFAELPTELRSAPVVRLQAGRALRLLGDWPRLLDALNGAPWPADEDLRLVYLAAAQRGMGNERDAGELWRMAVIGTAQDARRILRMMDLIEEWGWREERYALLWELFNLMPSNVPVRDALIGYELERGHTANLNKLFARIVQADPKDEVSRNNFAYTSLLLDTNLASAHLNARSVFMAHPDEALFRTTYAYALFKQGQVNEAWDVMQELPLRERPQPARIALRALFSAATGRTNLAADLLNDLPEETLLPEELEIAATTRGMIARAGENQDKETRLASLGSSGGQWKKGGWAALLPSGGPEKPTVDMRLADSLYAEGDVGALQEALAAARWEGWEHIRVALLAWLERARASDAGAEGLWRQALVRAGIDGAALLDLSALAQAWGWSEAKIEVTARLYERTPADEGMLNDLIKYFRGRARAHEISRLLWMRQGASVPAAPIDGARCVYFSILAQIDVSSAHTLARRVYDAAPDPSTAAAYGLSLWRQGRQEEAWAVLSPLDAGAAPDIPVTLIQALVLSARGDHAEALLKLGKFLETGALPEEIAWVDRVRQAAADAAAKARKATS